MNKQTKTLTKSALTAYQLTDLIYGTFKKERELPFTDLQVSNDDAILSFSPLAYGKMMTLVQAYDTEVAWYGVGKKDFDGFYSITDILVYPQLVSATTVEMDETRYGGWVEKAWLEKDERYNNIILQGHSHVNMNTSPSGVDIGHQKEIYAQLTDDMFYIFVIFNKRFEHTAVIVDKADKVAYPNDKVKIIILSKEITQMLCEAQEQVKPLNIKRSVKK